MIGRITGPFSLKSVFTLLAFSVSSLGFASMAGGAASHFTVVFNGKDPSPAKIAGQLERTWEIFHDLFGVEPAPVRVIITAVSGTAPGSSADRQSSTAAPPQHEIAWAIKEGEDLSGQTFSDLSHEITHIYFIDYMEDKGGLHQSNAWLHEAAAIRSELDPFRKNRETWIREHIKERIPLELLFTMKNPQKQNPLVELTVKLHEKLAKGEITAEELNRQISDFAQTHAEELSQAGIRNMTYYSESFSIFKFLLDTEGKEFIRRMSLALKNGKTMVEIIRGLKTYPKGIPQLEQAWADRVEKS